MEMGTSPEAELRWASVQEMLGLTDLPFRPDSTVIKEHYNKPAVLEITFRRELTPYEAEQFRRIMTKRPWPSQADPDAESMNDAADESDHP